MFTEDLSIYLADFGSSATLNGTAVTAIVDTSSLVEVDGVVTQGPTALLRTADASVAPGSTFTASAVNYSVRQVLREPPDGVMTRLVLVRS